MVKGWKVVLALVAGTQLVVGCGGRVQPGNSPADTSAVSSPAPSSSEETTPTASTARSGTRRTTPTKVDPTEPAPIILTRLSQPRPEGVSLPFPGAEVVTNIELGKQGGRLVINRFGEGPRTLNLITANDSGSNDVIGLIHSSLVAYDPQKQEYKPGLLEEYFPDAEDPTSWTLRLREGLLWSDGKPITSDDVVFAAEAIYNENITSALRDIMRINDEPLKFEAVDERTIRLTLPAASASVISMLTFAPVPRHAYGAAYAESADAFVAAMSVDVAPSQIIGSGPFRYKEFVRGQRVVLERNPNYYQVDINGVRLPYVDEIILAYSPDQDQMVVSFRRDGDVLDRIRPEALPRILEDQDSQGWTVYDVGPGNASSLFFFNLKEGVSEKTGRPHVDPDKLQWFRNRDFREAALRAIDRQSIINSELRGLATPLHGMVVPSNRLWHNPDVPRFDYDPEVAKAILDRIGLLDSDGDGIREAAPGKPLVVTIITNKGNKVREAVGLMIANDLRKVGIGARLETVEWNALLEMTDTTYTFEACLMGLQGGLGHAQGSMNTWPSFSRTNLHNPRQASPSTEVEARIDELCRKFTATADPDEQVQIYHEIQAIHAQEVLVLPLWVSTSFFAGRDRIGNWKPTPAADLSWNAHELFVR
jgi:peptide/nickel transport system substrate-binding protein